MKVIQGDALTELRKLPEESVNCCVTSPPYWGLRDYGIPKRDWGGDPDHAHVWGLVVTKNASTNHVDKRRWAHAVNGRGEPQPLEKRVGGDRKQITQGFFCECGAWLGTLGLEPTPELYTAHIVEIFKQVRRVLRADGTLWLNMGDCYANDTKWGGATGGKHANGLHGDTGTGTQKVSTGLKPKDLVGMPWRVAFALQAAGWYLRSDIIWHKPNPMPESVTDRPTKAHEYLFLLSKGERYYYDAEVIKEPATGTSHDRARMDRPDKWPNAWSAEPGRHDGIGNGRFTGKSIKVAQSGSGIKYNASFNAAVTRTVERRNKRTVWTISTKPYKGAHFATFPPKLIEPCILAGCPEGGVVLDPFGGAGTTGLVCEQLGRESILIELNPEYCEMAVRRIPPAAVVVVA